MTISDFYRNRLVQSRKAGLTHSYPPDPDMRRHIDIAQALQQAKRYCAGA